MNYEKIKNQKSKLRIDKHLSLVFLTLFLMLAACGKGSVASLDAFLKINKNKLSNFIGIKSLNRSADGSYVLYWDHPTNLSDISKISYKIYLSKWSSIPGAAVSDSAVLTSEDEGTLVKSQAIQLDSSESPVGKGVLLSSLAGARSYKLDFPLKNDVIYAFQVIASLPDEPSDSNQRVLVYDPSSNLLGFEGISGLSIADGGFLKLNWKAPSLAGILPDQIKYSIYVSTTKQAVDTLVSAATLVDTIKTAGQAQVVDVAESVLPSLEQPTSAVQTGGSSYTFNKVFSLGVTYLFEVRALGPAGELDNNRRIIVYRRSKLNFAGLSVKNAVLANDSSRIDLSWSAATGGSSNVSYEVYDNAEMTSAIGQTSQLTYTISNPTPGRLYTLGVKAKDESGFDDNSQVVTVAVPDTRDKLAPIFAGLVSASAASDKKILLSWAASPSTDLFKYNIYRSNNLSTPIASTSSTSYLLSGLSPGTSYTFVVRALDTSGNEESNVISKSATTLTQGVPDFAGLVSANTLADTAGLTGVTLSWAAATGSVTGYRIYMATSSAGQNFSTPISNVSSINTGNSTIGAYIAGQYTTSATITGLTQGTNYYFVVRAFYWDGSSVRTEINQVERSVTTNQAQAPTFAGVTAVTTPLSVSGFTQLNVAWTAVSNSELSNFSYYELAWASSAIAIDWSSATQISDASASSYTITGLSPNTTYFVAVRAVNATGSSPVSDGGAISLSGLTTPKLPTGDNFTAMTAVGTRSVSLSYTAPSATAASSGLYNNIFLFIYQGNTAAVASYRSSITPIALASITSSLSGGAVTLASAPTAGALIQVPAGQFTAGASNSFQINGLNSNQQVCVRALAVHWVNGQPSYYLESQTSSSTRCATPTVSAASFAGLSSLSSGSTVSGFTQLTATWSAISGGDASNFSYYEIAWATSSGGIDWSSATQIANAASTSYTITGLTANTTYYAAVRAVNNLGSSPVSNGGTVIVSAATTPLAANGDSFSAAASAGPTSVSLSYTAPSATASVGGLYNNLFLFVYQGTTTQLANYYTASVPIVTASITASLAAGSVTLGSAPTSGAIIQVSPGQFTAGAANTFTIAGLNPNQQTCVKLVAAYWVNGSYYLPAQAPTSRCVTPIAAAPVFAGVSSLSGAGDQSDFSLITANWGSITGSCSSLDVSISTSSASANFTTASFPGYKNLSCSLSSVNITGLARNTTYFIQVRAKYLVNSVAYSSGQDVELSKTTVPTSPSGDGVSTMSFTDQSKGTPTAAVSWSLPSAGVWNKVFLWRASGNDQATATAAVRAAAATNVGFTGPTSAPLVQYNVASPATNTTASYADNSSALTRGPYWCYLMRAVYDDGVFYNASANQTVQCGVIASTPMSFNGMSSSNSLVSSTWSDGTAKIKLQFTSPPSGNADEFWVYYSPSSNLANFDLTNAPWQIVDNTAVNAYNSGYPTPSFIYVGGQGRTFSGDGYFLVRAVRYGSTDIDSNTAISNLVSIPAAQSNYVYVSTSVSRLSYPYWIGTYEASLASGSLGSDTVSATETNLQSCSYQFHVNGVAKHANCGSFASTGIAQSVSGVSPVSATWHQAWTACRNATTLGAIGTTGATSSAGNLYARLPSETEWRRASRWAANNYANQWTVYSGGAGNCNTASGSLANTGAGSSCISSVNAFDMAGNQREWVDQRMTMYDISSNSESRFGYGPQIGRLLANGLETQASGVNSPVTRRYHNITPGANNLGLLMGSDYATSGYTYQKQYDAETESWQDPTLSTATGTAARGFRCVAFPSSLYRPSMAQLAQVSEPTYSTADIPGSPTPTAAQALTWKIPENFYVKDTRAETVSHILSFFPNTTSLMVWPMNNSSSGSQTDITDNGKTLSLSGTLGTAQGLDGNSYANSFDGSTTSASSGDSMFAITGSYTFGGWFYKSDWRTPVQTNLMSRSSSGWTDGYILWLSGDGSIYLNEGGNYIKANNSYRSLAAGWHHIVAVRGSATDHRLYVDGTLGASSAANWSITSLDTNFVVGGASSGYSNYSGSMANIFFHAGIGYTAQQVQRLYYGSMVNNTPYANSTKLASSDGIKISWSPWTKQSCTSSCSSSADTGFTYYIYRYIEPTKVDIRPSIPWAIKHGPYASLPSALSGANATAMPMDPLATDSSGNLLCSNSSSTTPMCTQVATISGSTCNSSASMACIFTDSAALNNGFSTTAIYNYIMVVRDAEGNFRVPRVQRYRSPYFAGDPSSTALNAFRTEQRWRRASVFLVDEALQQNAPLQSNSQTMVHVPMDQSGLDHDFFIHKYESAAFTAGGLTLTNNSPTGGQYPLQADTSGVWQSKAASCRDNLLRTTSFNLSACGDGSAVNSTSILTQSSQGLTPKTTVDQGAAWKACRNTGVLDGSGNSYYTELPSDSEWFKAADWGDVAQQGTITQSQMGQNIGQTISTLEWAGSTFNAATTSGSPTMTGISSTSGLAVGQVVWGAGVPTASTIISIVTNSSVTLSANATTTYAARTYYAQSSSAIFTGTTTNASPTITSVASTAGLAVGQILAGPGIPSGTTVVSFVANTSVTMSANATANATVAISYRPDGACNSDSSKYGGSYFTSASARTGLCRSRYGAADMVGNAFDWTAGQAYNTTGLDNGNDGLYLGQSLAISAVSSVARVDFLRSTTFSAGSMPTVSQNGDVGGNGSASTGLWATMHGGATAGDGGYWGTSGGGVGRWLMFGQVPTGTYVMGFRCSLSGH